jgi:hypothetical protein
MVIDNNRHIVFSVMEQSSVYHWKYVDKAMFMFVVLKILDLQNKKSTMWPNG